MISAVLVMVVPLAPAFTVAWILSMAEVGEPLKKVRKELLQILTTGDGDARADAVQALAVAKELDEKAATHVVEIMREFDAEALKLKKSREQWLKDHEAKVVDAKRLLAEDPNRQDWDLLRTTIRKAKTT